MIAGRKYDQGPELVNGGVDFRVWAPEHRQVDLLIEGADPLSMQRTDDGYWRTLAAGLTVGAHYGYRVDGSERLADPASRLQPEGPSGWSEVVDGGNFRWSDGAWKGLRLPRQVIYEMHLGTFSAEGTWHGAMVQLPRLRDLGATIVEVMPVGEFAGRFGWGYDGVDLYAPYHVYGAPDDFRRFVDTAHALGLGVMLDVLYNHFGPEGATLARFASAYFSEQQTEWGRAINYDGPNCGPVRRFVIDNAAYWISEFHLDGLRLDATHGIYDNSSEHIITALTRAARLAAAGREIIVVAENEPQDSRMIASQGLDGLWNDDFQHSAQVALTGRREAYFADYQGNAREMVASAASGFLYQGQLYTWQQRRRGHRIRSAPSWMLVNYLENHDQVANSLWGQRLWQSSSPAAHRVMTAYLLLGPWTPLLFQGQEWNASAAFLYFADHMGEVAEKVLQGRGKFLRQFPSMRDPEAVLPDPADPRTFETCRLSWSERDEPRHVRALALHRDLLELRRNDSVLAAPQQGGVTFDGRALTETSWVLRYFGANGDDRLLVCNLGTQTRLGPVSEPLLAPPEGGRWRLRWSSEQVRYGGSGVVSPEDEDGRWDLPGQTAVFLEWQKSG